MTIDGSELAIDDVINCCFIIDKKDIVPPVTRTVQCRHTTCRHVFVYVMNYDDVSQFVFESEFLNIISVSARASER